MTTSISKLANSSTVSEEISRSAKWLIASLLTLHAVMLVWASWRHSPTNDEIAYLPAGLSHWQLQRFELANVSPPLIRLVAAVPVLFADPQTDWHNFNTAPLARPAHQVGFDFIEANGPRTMWLFTIARWAIIPFSLIGAFVCFNWARDLFGVTAGMVGALLWCFCPNILGHGHLVSTDVGAASLGAAAAYMLWRWLRQPSWKRAAVAGAVLGVAELTKTTLIIFFLLWPLIWLYWQLCDYRTSTARNCFSGILQLGTIMLVALYVLNLGYAFEGSFQPLGSFQFSSELLKGSGVHDGELGNRFAGTVAGLFPVPLPTQYVCGLDVQRTDLENVDGRLRTYFRGDWHTRGLWYYYLYGLAIKVPLGTIVLCVLSMWVRLGDYRGLNSFRSDFVLIFPAVAILVMVSSQTGFNQHVRYAIPVLPFAYIWIAKVGSTFNSAKLLHAIPCACALVWVVSSSVWAFPHSLSYFNELAGGPKEGHFHLLDSNVDWGQDLLLLKDWMHEHGEATPITLAYLGPCSPKHARIDPLSLQDATSLGEDHAPKPGWYAISVGYLRGDDYRDGPNCGQFLALRPYAYVGYSILIYYVPMVEPDQSSATE